MSSICPCFEDTIDFFAISSFAPELLDSLKISPIDRLSLLDAGKLWQIYMSTKIPFIVASMKCVWHLNLGVWIHMNQSRHKFLLEDSSIIHQHLSMQLVYSSGTLWPDQTLQQDIVPRKIEIPSELVDVVDESVFLELHPSSTVLV